MPLSLSTLIAFVLFPLLLAAVLLGTLGWRHKKREEERRLAEQRARLAREEAERLDREEREKRAAAEAFEQVKAAEQARREEILQGSATMRQGAAQWRLTRGRGQIELVFGGGFAVGEGPRIVTGFERAGALDFLGHSPLIDADLEQQELFTKSLPAQFRPKIVYLDCPAFTIGTSAAPPHLARENRELWEQHVVDASDIWLERVARYDHPGALIVLLSSGGMTTLVRPALNCFHRRHPQVPIYVVAILDQKTELRGRFPEIRKLYSTDGLIRGWIVLDNRRDSDLTDVGLACLLPGMVVSNWIASRPLALWNFLALAFPADDPGRIATLSVWTEPLTVRYEPPWRDVFPEIYFTDAEQVEVIAMRGIKSVLNDPRLQSLPLEPEWAGSPRLCMVTAPVIPPHLQQSAERVQKRLDYLLSNDPDLSVQFAPIGALLTPTTRETPLVVSLLQLIKDGPRAVDALALGASIDLKFLAPPLESSERPEDQQTNGEVRPAEVLA